MSLSSCVWNDGGIRVECAHEELCHFSTIEVLPEEIILEVFYLYKLACGSCASEWQKEWHKLAHVCRRWRTIMFTSQHRLDLRLLCTPKTSIKTALDLWPALPIVVQYALGSLSPDDRDKISSVLQQPNRVCEINLDLYHPLSETESKRMQETFPLLEYLALCSWQDENPVLPNTFLSGSAPRLNVLHLYGITFPALPRLLSSANDLVDLLLHRIPSTGYISPEALVGGLSATPRLKTLSLQFAPTTSYLKPPLPSSGRIIVFALIHLTFDGPCDYLEDLLSRISASSLKRAKIEFFDQPSFDISQLSQFLGRVESQRPRDGAHAMLYLPDTFVYRPRSAEWLTLSLTCQSRFELSQMNQICEQMSPFLSDVRTLDIHTSIRLLGDDEDLSQWLDLFHFFSHVEQFHVTGSSTPNIARVLQLVSAEMVADVLPALRELTLDPVTHEVSPQLYSDSEW